MSTRRHFLRNALALVANAALPAPLSKSVAARVVTTLSPLAAAAAAEATVPLAINFLHYESMAQRAAMAFSVNTIHELPLALGFQQDTIASLPPQIEAHFETTTFDTLLPLIDELAKLPSRVRDHYLDSIAKDILEMFATRISNINYLLVHSDDHLRRISADPRYTQAAAEFFNSPEEAHSSKLNSLSRDSLQQQLSHTLSFAFTVYERLAMIRKTEDGVPTDGPGYFTMIEAWSRTEATHPVPGFTSLTAETFAATLKSWMERTAQEHFQHRTGLYNIPADTQAELNIREESQSQGADPSSWDRLCTNNNELFGSSARFLQFMTQRSVDTALDRMIDALALQAVPQREADLAKVPLTASRLIAASLSQLTPLVQGFCAAHGPNAVVIRNDVVHPEKLALEFSSPEFEDLFAKGWQTAHEEETVLVPTVPGAKPA